MPPPEPTQETLDREFQAQLDREFQAGSASTGAEIRRPADPLTDLGQRLVRLGFREPGEALASGLSAVAETFNPNRDEGLSVGQRFGADLSRIGRVVGAVVSPLQSLFGLTIQAPTESLLRSTIGLPEESARTGGALATAAVPLAAGPLIARAPGVIGQGLRLATGVPEAGLPRPTPEAVNPFILPTSVPTTRQEAFRRTSQTAQVLGLDLSLAEQTGGPTARKVEAFLERGLGGGAFETLGARQTQQATGILERMAGTTAAEAPARLARATAAFEAEREHFRRLAASAEQTLTTLVGGPGAIVDTTPLLTTLAQIREAQPALRTLEDPKLARLLREALGPKVTLPPLGPFATVHGGAQALMPTELLTGPLTFEQVRRLRSAFGKLAFPKAAVTRAEGAAATALPIAEARQIYGALTETLRGHAAKVGPDAAQLFDQATHLEAFSRGPLSAPFYREILRQKAPKTLDAFNTQIFNPQNTSLLDSLLATFDEAERLGSFTANGRRVLQQQFFDHLALSPSTGVVRAAEAGLPSLDGRAFAQRMRATSRVRARLFEPEAVKAQDELANLLSVASRTSRADQSELAGILITMSGQLVPASAGLITAAATGTMAPAVGGLLPAAISFGLARVMANPTVARGFASLIRGPRITPEGRQAFLALAARTLGANANAERPDEPGQETP